MSWGYVAIAGATLVSGYLGSKAQKDAAGDAADAAEGTGNAQIDESRRQFDKVADILNPYVTAGTGSLNAQQALLGLAGNDAQRAAIAGIERSPGFTSLMEQGENAILQNASATGGLRGGNVQDALMKFRPQALASQIQQRFQNLNSLTQTGANAAGALGSASQNSSQQILQALGEMGASRQGQALAGGEANAGFMGSIGKAAGGLIGGLF